MPLLEKFKHYKDFSNSESFFRNTYSNQAAIMLFPTNTMSMLTQLVMFWQPQRGKTHSNSNYCIETTAVEQKENPQKHFKCSHLVISLLWVLSFQQKKGSRKKKRNISD